MTRRDFQRFCSTHWEPNRLSDLFDGTGNLFLNYCYCFGSDSPNIFHLTPDDHSAHQHCWVYCHSWGSIFWWLCSQSFRFVRINYVLQQTKYSSVPHWNFWTALEHLLRPHFSSSSLCENYSEAFWLLLMRQTCWSSYLIKSDPVYQAQLSIGFLKDNKTMNMVW